MEVKPPAAPRTMKPVGRILIVANPASGRGRARRAVWELTCALAGQGLSWDARFSRSRDDLRSACRSAAPGYTALVAVGGDGTVGEILQEIGSRGPALAIWPAGTANLLARELGFPADAARLSRALARERTRAVDLGECRWEGSDLSPRRFAACVGAGFDARVVRHLAAARAGPIRWTSYAGPLVRGAAEAAAARDEMEIETDGGERTRGRMAVVTNLIRYGGFFRIAPGARCDDGLLDAVLFPSAGPADLVRYAVGSLRGRAARGAVRQARRVAIRPAPGVLEKAPVQVDGEPIGTLPVRIDVLPGAVRVIDTTE